MIFFNELLVILWATFYIYWIISALKAKKNIRNSNRWKGALFRISIFVIIILLFKTNKFQQLAFRYDVAPHVLMSSIGIFLCIVGLAFAVWARIYLGRNWGMPMSTKENPELVINGPYKLVRHPIYSGMLLAVLGSSMVDGLWWFIFFIFFVIYFVFYSARIEEKLMMEQFPNEYPAYKKRTKMLIPFLF